MVESGIEIPPKVPKRQKSFLRRKQIVDALRRIIIQYGSEQITVKKLAEEIGFSVGALHRHFKSKRGILLLLIDESKANLNGNIEKTSPIQNPSQLLREVAGDLLSSIEQRKGSTFIISAEIISLGDKGLNWKLSEVLKHTQ